MNLADFTGRIGTTFQVTAAGGEHAMILETATAIEPSVRENGSFRLEFRGPPNPILEQAIYPIRSGEFSSEIFIVPIGRDASGTLYEAVFN